MRVPDVFFDGKAPVREPILLCLMPCGKGLGVCRVAGSACILFFRQRKDIGQSVSGGAVASVFKRLIDGLQ